VPFIGDVPQHATLGATDERPLYKIDRIHEYFAGERNQTAGWGFAWWLGEKSSENKTLKIRRRSSEPPPAPNSSNCPRISAGPLAAMRMRRICGTGVRF
jgi:hypothetical protein